MASAARLVCCRLPVDRRTLIRYGRALGLSEPSKAIRALARSIAASPVWAAAPDAVVMVRSEPEPMLAVMGRFDEGHEAWLAVQARVLGKTCGRLRLVGYRRAEEGCERLAAALTDRLGRDELRRARFTAVPRGGFVVLGWLAIALGLDRRQLEPPHPPELPLIAVDDCAISGSRCRDFLDQHEAHGKIVFAHLYSHPELRAAIEARESRVHACLSAEDLGAEGESPLEPEWRVRFLAKIERAYWIGATDALAFPWSEPDRLIWHPVEDRPALAWRVVPPELCLKNRATRPIAVQEQPEAKGPLRPEGEVMFGEREERVVLHHLGRGESKALDAVGSDFWKAIIRSESLSEVVAELGREYPVTPKRLRRDLAAFTEQLIDRGFLERY